MWIFFSSQHVHFPERLCPLLQLPLYTTLRSLSMELHSLQQGSSSGPLQLWSAVCDLWGWVCPTDDLHSATGQSHLLKDERAESSFTWRCVRGLNWSREQGSGLVLIYHRLSRAHTEPSLASCLDCQHRPPAATWRRCSPPCFLHQFCRPGGPAETSSSGLI